MDYTIATLGSHSCLQILKGAKEEGFGTLAIATPKMARFYHHYPFIDEIKEISDWKEFFALENELMKKEVIVVPHGSFVAYLGLEENKKMKIPTFGNRNVLDWESDRTRQREWLMRSQIRIPHEFQNGSEINRAVIVKFFGAEGGKGYFVAHSKEEFEEKIAAHKGRAHIIQEYVIGNPIYIHYFVSSLTGEVEIMSIDRRYETNADSLGRIPLKAQEKIDIEPSFVVVGNIPLTLRESMLAEAQEMGERLVDASKKLIDSKGLYGPFCLETVVTPDQQFYVIEISARIVAGTNIFVPYSPYTYLKYGEAMTTGKRIAREIRLAIEQKRLEEVLG